MTTIAQPSAADRAGVLAALAKQHKADRDILEARLQALEDEVAAAHRRKMPGILTALAAAEESKAALADEIERNRDLFDKPKTMTLHATRFGLVKGKGKLEWEDADVVVARIEKQHPDEADTLINTTKKPNRAALQDLDVKTLRRLGVTVEETGEQPFIKATDGDATKMVKKLLKESTGRIPEGDA